MLERISDATDHSESTLLTTNLKIGVVHKENPAGRAITKLHNSFFKENVNDHLSTMMLNQPATEVKADSPTRLPCSRQPGTR